LLSNVLVLFFYDEIGEVSPVEWMAENAYFLQRPYSSTSQTIQSHQDHVVAEAMDALIAAEFSRNLGLLNIKL
jgi:pyridoxine/pyridoxamine 5'-phosphate oxidase